MTLDARRRADVVAKVQKMPYEWLGPPTWLSVLWFPKCCVIC